MEQNHLDLDYSKDWRLELHSMQVYLHQLSQPRWRPNWRRSENGKIFKNRNSEKWDGVATIAY